ncbi:DUF6634 family protein [uncultured Sulfitobacter sp.]|uniref:DUF6634 family protein n=1 Tax=uncultured Sulfitobacter sp. TaxID=191468 RepID=UPI002632E72D|nr:DUF6634 family protein [uncultured Sulfitobacter sp.]
MAFTGADGVLYAVADTIPSEALEALEAMPSPVKYVLVDEVWSVLASEWMASKRQLMSTLGMRLTNRSLQLGVEGPADHDLEAAPLLNPWTAIRDPQCGGAILLGIQSGHPTLKCRLINSSRLCGIAADQSWARTASRWYRLKEEVTTEDLVERLGHQVGGLEHLTLDAREVKAFVERDQIDAGVRDV